MAKKSRKDLKNYFQTKSVPTQGNFEDLIDSLLHIEEDYLFGKGVAIYPKNPTDDNDILLEFYNKKPQDGDNPLWTFRTDKTGSLMICDKNGKVQSKFTQEQTSYSDAETAPEYDEIKVKKITVNTADGNDKIVISGQLHVDDGLNVDKIKPNKSDEVSIEGVLKDIVKLVAKKIESDSIVTNNATVNNEITNRELSQIKSYIDKQSNCLGLRAFFAVILDFSFLINLLILIFQKKMGGNIHNVIGWLKKKLDDNPAMKEMIVNFDLKRMVEMVDCLDVIKDVNLQAIVDRNNFPELIDKMGISKLVEKSGVLDDSQRIVTLFCKKNNEFAGEKSHLYPIIVVTNKRPILLCAEHTQENVFEIYPTKYVEGEANFKINWVDDHETDEKKLILESLSSNPDEYILYGIINITDYAAVKEEFTIRDSGDVNSVLQYLVGHDFYNTVLDLIFSVNQVVINIDASKSCRKLTGGNIDISNVIGLLKNKLEDNPVMKEMIANYDLKKLVETVDCLNVIKNVNLQAMIDKNDFTGLIEKVDIFKLVGKNGVLDDSQRTATLIRKKKEEFASEGFHSYPIVVVTNKKPILLCANHTKENEFEVYPTKYAEGNEGFKLNWVDDHETDEKTLMLEYLSDDPDEYILYGMIKTDLA